MATKNTSATQSGIVVSTAITAGERITSLRRITRRAALGLAVPVIAALGAAPAQAADRPDFKVPFACGQMWRAWTYDGHAGAPEGGSAHWKENAIDMEVRQGSTNISKGEPVLASADGKVVEVDQEDDPEDRMNQVTIDHGDGWITRYLHLEELPTDLHVNDMVAQGEQIGRVGNTGPQPMAPHLHYEQRRRGDGMGTWGPNQSDADKWEHQPVVFDGQEIETNANAPMDTWGEGEYLTSTNCPGRAFLPFDQDGKRHLFSYAPGPGDRQIASINSSTDVTTKSWPEANPRWTHFMPFKLDGEQRYLSYKSGTGEAHYGRIDTGSMTQLSGQTWGKGWTHLMPFTLGANEAPYFVAYNSLTGGANVARINAQGTAAPTVPAVPWSRGWTLLVPFRLSGVQYMLAYRGASGEVKIHRITGSGDSVSFTNVFHDTWRTGWTHIVPMTHNGAVHLLRYNQSGWAKFDKVNPGGAGVTTLGYSLWSKGWSVFSPFTIGGKGHVLVYKTGSGQARVLKLNDDGSGVTTTRDLSWMRGLA